MNGDLAALLVSLDATLLEALEAINRSAIGIAFAADADGRIVGTLTDGDVRRAILAGAALDARCIPATLNAGFRSVTATAPRAEVLDMMKALRISRIPMLDEAGRLAGVHLLERLIGTEVRPNWAVIMAGGKGTRLRPLTENMPKPMIPVAGRPILERLVLHLVSSGLRRIFISVNYLGSMIEHHFGDGSAFGCTIEYLREDTPLGTGGPLSLLPERPDLPLLVMNGDLVTQFNVGRMLDFHESNGFDAVFGARPYSFNVPYGVITADGDRLVTLEEKPRQEMLVNAGIYSISPGLLRDVPGDREFPITELFQPFVGSGRLGVFVLEDDWIDVGVPSELGRARGIDNS